MKMRKLVAVLMAVMMLMCIVPFSAAAEGGSATIDFTDKENRVSYSTEQQVWAQNGITVTNNKGASTSNVGDYGGEGYPARFYKSSTVTIEYPGITGILIECRDLEAKYVNGWADSATGATATVDGGFVTITLAEAANSFTWETLTSQSRAYSITVYTDGSAPVVPDVPVTPDPEPDMPGTPAEVVETPVVGTAYKFGMVQGNVSATDVYYLIGGMNSYYLATGTDVKAAIDVYLEETDGGYYLYTMVGGAKTYINMVVNGTHVNGAYEAAASTVYTYDADAKTIVATVNDALYWFGTRNDKTYTTVGPCAVEYKGFYCQFYSFDGGTTPDVPVDPPVDPPVTPDPPVVPPVSGDFVTITFDDLANRLSVSTEQQVWSMNGITVINDKGASTSNVNEKYFAPIRFYKNSDVTVEYPGMTKIVFHCNTASYATALADAIGVTAEDTLVTVELAGVDSYVCTMTAGQVRVDSIDVYGEGGAPVDPPVVPDPPVDPPVDPLPDIPNGEIETDYPFLFGMTQYNVSEEAVYFLAGGMDGYYMATTEDPDAAIEVYVEATDGGYYFYTYDGADKLYINMVVNGTHVNGAYEATASTVYIYAEEYGTLIAEVNGAYYWFGTRNDATYTTMGPCKIEYEGFYGEFYYYESEGGDTPVDPPVEDDIDVTIPYLFGMVQENLSWDDIYFLAGGMDGYYMATTTDENAAIEVWLEIADGGYYFYTYDGADKLYINMVVSGTHVNGAYEATASTVYTYDWDLGTLVAEVNGSLYAFGTRADREYTTMGPCKVEYDSFFADLYFYVEDDTCEHEYEAIEEAPTCGEDGLIIYECTLCGDCYTEVLPATGEHTYDDDTDAECNVCGNIREVIAYVGSIAVSTAEGSAGSTVKVTVSMNGNPGLISAKVKVLYDNTVLKLVGYEAGNFSLSGYSWGDIDKANGSFIINWCDAINPDSTADLLATLTFEVLEGAADGFTPIELEFDCAGDMFNAADETVWFGTVNGGVEIGSADYVLGDLDGNGRINNRDMGMLQQYINEWPVNINVDAADLDGNGRVNNRDLGKLQQIINEWDI